MSRSRAHPQRETKIIRWINTNIKPGEEFQARDIAKALNIMPVEVGNLLKKQEGIQIVGYMNGSVWQRKAAIAEAEA